MQRLLLVQEELKTVLSDFSGISINPYSASEKILEFLLVFVLFFQMYCIGRLFERVFRISLLDKKIRFFVRFALGYIVISSLIFILGLFGHLTRGNVMILLIVITFVSLSESIKHGIKIPIPRPKLIRDPINFLTLIFLIIYFLRVLPPAVNGDGNDYHISFPRVYLMEKTMMVPPLGDESYSTVPHLTEMLYIPAEILSGGEISRIIHLGFFYLVFYLFYVYGFSSTRHKVVNQFAALLFVSAPLVLHIAPSPFSDFPAILCLMLVGYILAKNKLSYKVMALAGVLMGGALASKVWVFVIFPVYFLYLLFVLRKEKFLVILKYVLTFFLFAFVVFGLWLVRSYLLTGHVFYINENLGRNDAKLSLMKYILQGFGSNYFQYRFGPTGDFGFIYLIGVAIAALNFKKLLEVVDKNYLVLVILLAVSALVLPFSYASGRYSLPYILPIYTISSFGLFILWKRRIGKVVMLSIFVLIAAYYSFNTLMQIPYAFGWADSRAYERRYVIRDPVAYYDFNGEFSKLINKNEIVMTYGMRVLSFAHFRHKNLYYFVDQENRDMKVSKSDTTKLLIRGGDYEWMCTKENIKNCDDYIVTELTRDSEANQVLYDIKYKNAK